MFSRFRAPIFKNTGSVARDHLASERTFLAWLRTGLGFVALGIAVERFSQLDLSALPPPPPSVIPPTNRDVGPGQCQQQISPVRRGRGTAVKQGKDYGNDNDNDDENSPILAGSLLGLGSGSILYGAARYFSTLRMLEAGSFRPAFHGAAVVAASVAGLAGGLLGSGLEKGRRRTRRREREVR